MVLPTEEREQIRAGLSAALADPNCPVQFSPLLAAARRALRSDPSPTVETVNGEMLAHEYGRLSDAVKRWAPFIFDDDLTDEQKDARASAPAGADGKAGHAELLAHAKASAEHLLAWCHQNEAEWTGWGDQNVPEGAVALTAQAERIVAAFNDPPILAEESTKP